MLRLPQEAQPRQWGTLMLRVGRSATANYLYLFVPVCLGLCCLQPGLDAPSPLYTRAGGAPLRHRSAHCMQGRTHGIVERGAKKRVAPDALHDHKQVVPAADQQA